jgi:acetyl-CoA acetyltransferase
MSEKRRSIDPVHVVGMAATSFLDEHDAMQDELVFEVVRAALDEAGLRKQDAGISILASMDVLDARSISSGLSTAAAGGYLNDSYRIEGDSGSAIIAAAEAVAAGDVEVAIAVGVHNPETRSADPQIRRAFLEQISNLSFDPHFDRPLGLTAETTYAMHAAHAVLAGDITIEELARLAAEEISTGAGLPRTQRGGSVDAASVTASAAVAWPLHDLMLPARSTGAVAVVLASPARAGRSLGRSARLTGLGRGSASTTWNGRWLDDAGAATRRAAEVAYGQAGVDDPAGLDVVEITAATPLLHSTYADALGLAGTGPVVNASGGARTNFPGLANGALRLLEVVEQLGERGAGSRGLAHSVDTQSGLINEDATVIVVEEV